MNLLNVVLDSSVGPHEFEVRVKDGHAELLFPGIPEPLIVLDKNSIRISIGVPGEPRPIRIKAWLLNKG